MVFFNNRHKWRRVIIWSPCVDVIIAKINTCLLPFFLIPVVPPSSALKIPRLLLLHLLKYLFNFSDAQPILVYSFVVLLQSTLCSELGRVGGSYWAIQGWSSFSCAQFEQKRWTLFVFLPIVTVQTLQNDFFKNIRMRSNDWEDDVVQDHVSHTQARNQHFARGGAWI